MEHAGKEERRKKEATFLRDEELKACFSKKEILAYLARTFSESFRGMVQKEVESCLIGMGDRESTTMKGSVRYDILVRFRSPREEGKEVCLILNVEGQVNPYPVLRLKARMCYYAARLIGDQKGDVFYGDDYQGMAQVLCVWLVMNPAVRDEGRIAV